MTYRTLLSRLNFLIFLALAALALLLQTTVFTYYPLHYFKPDFLLLFAIFFGFRRSLIEGSVFVAIASYFFETHSSAGSHFFFALYLYAFLIAKLISRTLVVPDFFSTIGIVVSLSVLKKIGVILLLGLVGKASNGFSHFLIYLLPSVLTHALLCVVAFKFFEWIDVITEKTDAARQGMDFEMNLEI